MNEKQKEDYTFIIFEIKRVFEEVGALEKTNSEENKLIIIEKSEELLQLYKKKALYKRQRYDERLFVTTLGALLKHRNNPLFVKKMQEAFKRD